MERAANRPLLKRLAALGVILSIAGCATPLSENRSGAPRVEAINPSADAIDLWPEPFPPVGKTSLRPVLTENIRKKTSSLGLNGLKAPDGAAISRAVVLLRKDRAAAGVITFEIESGTDKGIHQCEALGRGATSFTPKPGWLPGTVREADGRETEIFYAPKDETGGATIPGVYDLRNIRPSEYKIKLLNQDTAGEEELPGRLTSSGADDKRLYTGVWKHWYPRDPRYADTVPVDMVWSSRYQDLSQGAGVPMFERPDVKKDPEQARRDPGYYSGPYGRYGFAIHTDRWDDAATAQEEQTAAKNEFRSFLFRDTSGCVKVHPDCLRLINFFVDEQAAKGRAVQLEVLEIN